MIMINNRLNLIIKIVISEYKILIDQTFKNYNLFYYYNQYYIMFKINSLNH